MKRRVEPWSVERLHKSRAQISFPEYQRQDRLWSPDKKALLIDSILQDIDIPKLYFNETGSGEFEVVDGQQRLWAIWEFLDDGYPITTDGKVARYSNLPPPEQKAIREYELQVTVFEDAEDDYLRELFLRLQLGLLLVTGEKLNAATGTMKEFVFTNLTSHEFMEKIRIPKRRYAKQTLCAQIAVNSFSRAKLQAFARTRYEDLLYFFQEYEDPKGADLELYRSQSKAITVVLDDLNEAFGQGAGDLRSRSYVLSVYLVFEELRSHMRGSAARKQFVEFTFALWNRLRQEISAGIDRANRELYVFETMLSSAPGERYQIERRHQKLVEYFDHYRKTGKVKGDP